MAKQKEPAIFQVVYNGFTLDFEVEYKKSTINWSLDKVGRLLEVSIDYYLDNTEEYKHLWNNFFGLNFIKSDILKSSDDVDKFFKVMGISPLLFDFIIIEASVIFEDVSEDFGSHFTQFHAIGLTVNGRKHLELNDVAT